jgi:protein SCO1
MKQYLTPLLSLVLATTLGTPALAQSGHGSHEGHSGAPQAGRDDHSHHQMPQPGQKVEYRTEKGLSIPDVPVVTQDGEELHFFHDLVEGKVVAMNFVFTTCTTICPPLGANFGKLQDLLAEEGAADVRLISVSVDPVTDTPPRLKAWGDVFEAGPNWTLVTGDKEQITELLKALQVFTPDIRDHSPQVLLGNAETGTWTRAYGLASPKDLAARLHEMSEAAEASR